MVAPLVLACVGALLLPGSLRSQVPDSRPTLQQVVTVTTATARFRMDPQRLHEGQPVAHDDSPVPVLQETQVLSHRYLDQVELVQLMLADPDGDRVPSISDAAPFDPDSATISQVRARRSGKRKATTLRAASPRTQQMEGMFEQVLLRFESHEQMLESFLEDNERQPVYDPEVLLRIAEAGGIPSETCRKWKQRFCKTTERGRGEGGRR